MYSAGIGPQEKESTDMKMTIGACTLLIVAPFAGISWADEALENHPGYVDLQARDIFGDEVEPTVEVLLEGPMLQLMAGAFREGDSELGEMLASLKLIRINAFPIAEGAGDVAAKFEALSKQLAEGGWSRVVRVKEDDEAVNVFMRADEDVIQGLVVLVAESEEAIFLNIVGDVNPLLLGKLGGTFFDGDFDFSEIAERISEHEKAEESESEEHHDEDHQEG